MTRIGEAVSRPEGPSKVTGTAKYAADHSLPGQLFGVFVGAPHAAGRITAIDAVRALALPRVVRVLTAADMPKFGALTAPAATAMLPMQSDEIRHEGQPVAIVLAETLEAAEAGAAAVNIEMTRAVPTLPGAPSVKPSRGFYPSKEADNFAKGDIEAGFAKADTRFEQNYLAPSRHHNPMEPSAVLATWDGDSVTLYDAVQHGAGRQPVFAAAFGIKPEQVRVICPHTGGGFGCKGFVWPHELLVAAAARITQRPVKVALSRAQMYTHCGYQPLIRHALKFGIDKHHAITAIDYVASNVTTLDEDFVERPTSAARNMVASPAIRLEQRVERMSVNMPTALRPPVEGAGTLAMESALDELAHLLKIDPLDLRLANYPEKRPADDKPWSSIKLREAYAKGAELFGWRGRDKLPETDGHWRLGRGMASCCMGTFRFPAAARVLLRGDGTAVVETGTHDIGSGTTTIFPQIAASMLGLPIASVSIRNGDTRLPGAMPTYGSSSTMGVGAAVMRAAEDARAKLAKLVGLPSSELDVAAAMRRSGVSEIVGDGAFALKDNVPYEEGGGKTEHAMATFGAVFVEVAVDPELGLLRLRRAVGAYSVGRIMNAMTARSQMTGGMIWGWGQATMEQSIHEPVHARFLNKNLSGVHIPVNADIPSSLVVHFVDEVDELASPVGGKGIGELGATGVAAAVANAVFDATGRRVREFPITPDKLV